MNSVQLLIKCTVKVQGCVGLSGFFSLYKVLLRSDFFLTHQSFLRELYFFFISTDCPKFNCSQIPSAYCRVSAGGFALIINLPDEKLLGPQCNTKSSLNKCQTPKEHMV